MSQPIVFVFAILETFIFFYLISLLLSTSHRPILFLCLRFLIAKCSFAVDEVFIKKVNYYYCCVAVVVSDDIYTQLSHRV